MLEKEPKILDPDFTIVDKEQKITVHLAELRKRILLTVAGVGIIFLILLPLSQLLFEYFAYPVIQNLTDEQSLIIRKPLDSFLIPLKLSLFVSIIIALPWILLQIWLFIAPALYKKERKLLAPLVISSALLFYLGIAFAYRVILPLVFNFLSSQAPQGTSYGPDIADYFSFVFTVFFAFGIAFETPIATILLVITKVVSLERLREKRRYVIVGSFVLGMLLTPPDVISQTLLAVPMWLLFELGLFIATIVDRKSVTSDNK